MQDALRRLGHRGNASVKEHRNEPERQPVPPQLHHRRQRRRSLRGPCRRRPGARRRGGLLHLRRLRAVGRRVRRRRAGHRLCRHGLGHHGRRQRRTRPHLREGARRRGRRQLPRLHAVLRLQLGRLRQRPHLLQGPHWRPQGARRRDRGHGARRGRNPGPARRLRPQQGRVRAAARRRVPGVPRRRGRQVLVGPRRQGRLLHLPAHPSAHRHKLRRQDRRVVRHARHRPHPGPDEQDRHRRDRGPQRRGAQRPRQERRGHVLRRL